MKSVVVKSKLSSILLDCTLLCFYSQLGVTKRVLFGTISSVFAAFIGNKTEIEVEILIVVDNKIRE